MIKIRKRDFTGEITWEYQGEVIFLEEKILQLEALFNRDDMPFQDILLKRNDRFVETFFSDRWYNVFEIHDRDDDSLKGWYCNICQPFTWDAPGVISYQDLLLDLWVDTVGKQSVLDVDEFESANLPIKIREKVLFSMTELRSKFDLSPILKTGFIPK
ncbi:MAG: DUF402 domain-containing protein [Chloroflexota bacterium]